MKNVMEKIREASKNINPWYDVTMNVAQEVESNSETKMDSVFNGFVLGYMQGMQSAMS